MELLSTKIEKNMSLSERKEYYEGLKKFSETLKKGSNIHNKTQSLINRFYKKDFYNEKIKIEGIENLPKQPAIYVCNHSNAHDIFSSVNTFAKLGVPISVVVGEDSLSFFTKKLFRAIDAVLLDRRDKVSATYSIFESASKIMEGKSIVLFGESTWNIHPTKAMHELKRGAEVISLITGAPIVPTIYEYILNNYIVEKEEEIYKKIQVRILKPVESQINFQIGEVTNNVNSIMAKERVNIWKENNITRDNLSNIDPMIYLNHTFLKKFGVFGFEYDSVAESAFLRGNQENEYKLNEEGKLVPGVTLKTKR